MCALHMMRNLEKRVRPSMKARLRDDLNILRRCTTLGMFDACVTRLKQVWANNTIMIDLFDKNNGCKTGELISWNRAGFGTFHSDTSISFINNPC